MGTTQYIGQIVKQVATNLPDNEKFIGRQSKVVDAFTDEKGQTHLQTEDGVWCPLSLMVVIEPVLTCKEAAKVFSKWAEESGYPARRETYLGQAEILAMFGDQPVPSKLLEVYDLLK